MKRRRVPKPRVGEPTVHYVGQYLWPLAARYRRNGITGSIQWMCKVWTSIVRDSWEHLR